jgi:hypothetical protein
MLETLAVAARSTEHRFRRRGPFSLNNQLARVAEAGSMKKTAQPPIAGSAHIAAAWLFLAAAIISGIVGVYRMMSAGAATAGTDAVNAAILSQHGVACICLGVLLGVIAAVLALLGNHKQLGVIALYVGPSYQGSHGSDDDG